MPLTYRDLEKMLRDMPEDLKDERVVAWSGPDESNCYFANHAWKSDGTELVESFDYDRQCKAGVIVIGRG